MGRAVHVPAPVARPARRRLLAGAAAVAAAPAVRAQGTGDWPNRPVRIVVPFAPGGGGDGSARFIADKLGERLGTQVVVENRPGATGYTGAVAVKTAPPDGYTLLLGFDGSLVIAPNFYKAPFDTLADFVPVTKLNDAALVMAAHPSLKARTLKELIELSRERPLQYGSSGAGSTPHMAGELLALRSGLRIEHVPYKGGGQAVLDVVSGQLPLIFTAVTTVAGFLKDGRLVPIVVASAQRWPTLPDVPTIAESGVPGFEVNGWFGVLAPAKTPRPIVDRLQREIAAVLAMPDIRERYLQAGFVPVGNSPDAFAAQVKADAERWTALVKDAKIRME